MSGSARGTSIVTGMIQGKDAFELLSDEHVADFNLDYIKPLKYGRVESGVKFRRRNIPTNIPTIHPSATINRRCGLLFVAGGRAGSSTCITKPSRASSRRAISYCLASNS